MNYEGTEVELVLNRNDANAHNLKAKAYENRMDRLAEAAKKADSASEIRRLSTLRSQTIEKYNKYRMTDHRN